MSSWRSDSAIPWHGRGQWFDPTRGHQLGFIMNIFFVDRNPFVAAQSLCDKHVVKMILETAQLLSTAHRIVNENLSIDYEVSLYKVTHKNHPSAKWVRQSEENYGWAAYHLTGLLNEYEYRYNKVHKVRSSGLENLLLVAPPGMKRGWKTVPSCMPDVCKISISPVRNYREYYNTHKTHLFTWTKRKPPKWLDKKNKVVYKS